MAGKGDEYEGWVRGLLPLICGALSINLPDDALLEGRKTLRGHYQSRHEVDLLADTGPLLMVECKDRGTLAQPERLDAYWSFADVAAAHPDRTVVGILVSRSPVSPATRRLFTRLEQSTGIGADFVRPPDNLVRPIALLTLPSKTICGCALLYQYTCEGAVVHVLLANPRNGDSEHLEHLVLESPDLTKRLGASLELLAQRPSFLQRLIAGLEAAICLFHVGLPDDALRFADATERLAQQDRRAYYAQNAYYVEELARLAIANRLPRGCPRPGRNAVRRLERQLEALKEVDASNVRTVLGAWHGLYGEDAVAKMHLERAREEARGLDSANGAYSSFLADLRTAELSGGTERAAWAIQAETWLPLMSLRHRPLATQLLGALGDGGSSSLAVVFPSSGIKPMSRRGEERFV